MSCSGSDCCSVHHTPKWIEENRADFKPPVCNKCMYADQLKVFFVGGPNQRKDYHLEEGEEVFYQIEGDMVLKVVEEGRHRDVSIKQGEIFLLPARIEHSPQRYEGTVGCVVERTRDKDELDCLRYFVEGSTDVLFERWFHCSDVVADLPPIIREFNASEEAKSGKPGAKAKLRETEYEPVQRKLADPVNLASFIEEHKTQLESGSSLQLFGPPDYRSIVTLLGTGKHFIESGVGELIVMPQRGEATLRCADFQSPLGPFDMARVRANQIPEIEVAEGGVVVTVRMTR